MTATEHDMPPEVQDRMVAAADFIGHIGATDFTLAHFDDELPCLVWVALATWPPNPRSRNPAAKPRRECAASLYPLEAVERLIEQVGDGGTCTHCGRGTAMAPDFTDIVRGTEDVLCWYAYDPETKRYRRACEGDT